MFENIDPVDAARWLGLLVPLIVGVISKRTANQGLKSVLNLLVSAIVGSLAYLAAADGGFDFGNFVEQTANAFLSSIVAYYGFLKPTGVAGVVANKTAGFGLGQPDLTANDKGAESAGR